MHFINYDTNEGIIDMLSVIPEKFYPVFKQGVDSYLEGKWEESKKVLNDALEILPSDGPSEFLLEVNLSLLSITL